MKGKSLLRNLFLLKREEMTETERTKRNMLIALQLKSFLQTNTVRTLHTFIPQKGKNEVDTGGIISMIREFFPDIQIIVPGIVPGTRKMEHYLLEEKTILADNKWGIPEPDPSTSQKTEIRHIDIVLIPLLAFDRYGYRVGYGGGYYDRFLPGCRPDTIKAGLSFFGPVDKITDTDQFDVPMDLCITPGKIFRWK
jgi:5-formyltetrahydrofolate cyclo-ligase